MDIQPLINAIALADPPRNPEHELDSLDISLTSQDFPLLGQIAKGFGPDGDDETRGRLAGFQHIHGALEAEFGDNPFGSLGVEGPTLSDQAEADDQLSHSETSTPLAQAMIEAFPGIADTIGRLEEHPFHTGVLIAYATTWLWLNELGDRRPVPDLGPADDEDDEPLAAEDTLDALSSWDTEAEDPDTAEPANTEEKDLAGVLRNILGQLADLGLLSPSIVLQTTVAGVHGENRTRRLCLQAWVHNDKDVLPVMELAGMVSAYAEITGVEPTVSIAGDQLKFSSLL